MRACVLIPHYEHTRQVAGVLDGLAPLGLPTIVVDDGSSAESFSRLAELVARCPWAELQRLAVNQGKGAAVMAGLRRAGARGFTHAVQIDADGQHRCSDIARLLAAARERPDALVSGCPVYDGSVPAARRHGRKVSLFWTQVETWSRDIQDAMCGFRVYPVDAVLAALGGRRPGHGMEFDAEALVRAHWAGITLVFVPTPVTYPEGGVSHFRMVRDNVRIAAMHTRLFFGMLMRLPALLSRRAPGRA